MNPLTNNYFTVSFYQLSFSPMGAKEYRLLPLSGKVGKGVR